MNGGSEHPEPDAGQPDRQRPAAPSSVEPRTVEPAVLWPDRTGHATIDAALRAVAEVADAAPADQLPAYQAAHRTLRETLASIDEG